MISKLMERFIPVIFLVSGFLVSSVVTAMTELHDRQLSEVTGQALLQMGKVQENGFSFYKAGLDAELELNMNIEKLQLGCTAGAVNGQHCDIDIDQLSLSGQPGLGGNFPNGNRPESSALLTRPFFEFAIKNDASKTLREVVGIRMSAENTKGMLTFGDQQAGSSDPGNTSGINSLSGYMKLGPTSGTARTEVRAMTYSDYDYQACNANQDCVDAFGGNNPQVDSQGLNSPMTGRVFLDLLGLGVREFSSTDYGLALYGPNPTTGASANVTTVTPSNPDGTTVVSGRRMTSVGLSGAATLDPINFSGQMAANVENVALGINLELQKNVTGSISGLTATVPIQQSLKYIHKINVNSAFSLSMQKDTVHWPGASEAAQQGWWMAFEDEIDIGNISPEADVAIDNAVLLQALGAPRGGGYQYWNGSQYVVNTDPPTSLGQPPISCVGGDSINCALMNALTYSEGRTYCDGVQFFGCQGTTRDEVYGVYCNGAECLGGDLPVGNLTVPANLDFPLNNLKLGAQAVTPNCYGSARFC